MNSQNKSAPLENTVWASTNELIISYGFIWPSRIGNIETFLYMWFVWSAVFTRPLSHEPLFRVVVFSPNLPTAKKTCFTCRCMARCEPNLLPSQKRPHNICPKWKGWLPSTFVQIVRGKVIVYDCPAHIFESCARLKPMNSQSAPATTRV